jgi:seryl-tRNA synthetase
MHDIKAIRDNPTAFDAGLARRGLAPLSASLLAIDEQKRDTMQKLQDAQSRRNSLSKEIGAAMGKKDAALADKLKAEVAGLKDFITTGEEQERVLTKQLQDALSAIPNTPLDEVPNGKDETSNVEVRRWGQKPGINFEPSQHFDVGENLKLMDFESAAKISGARFVVTKGQLARLERALAQYMLDTQTDKNGYVEYNVPLMVTSKAMYGTGQLPKFSEDLFATRKSAENRPTYEDAKISLMQDGTYRGEASNADIVNELRRLDALSTSTLWLIPTAEVSLTNLVRENIVEETVLPLRLTACTPCFRAEAGSAGRDTRGMIRQHQFTKVELVSITTPEQSRDELERMTASAESILQGLALHYRVIKLCAGDMGFGSMLTYDLEVWLPGQNTFREISSCSMCGDFQARRMDARYKSANGKGTRYVHTLNGSGLAVGRTLVAILENYQNGDGSVTIPEVLRPYMGGMNVIKRS